MPGRPPNDEQLPKPNAHPEWVRNEYRRIGRDRLESERQMSRALRWLLVRSCVECLAASAAGAIVMGFGFHTSDREMGKIYVLGGMVVGYSLITIALARAYARWQKYN